MLKWVGIETGLIDQYLNQKISFYKVESTSWTRCYTVSSIKKHLSRRRDSALLCSVFIAKPIAKSRENYDSTCKGVSDT